MAFFTKVDYSRQLRQRGGTTATFSGSTQFYESFFVQTSTSFDAADGCNCFPCSTGATFIVGDYSATSASCNVTITSFSGQTGLTQVLAIGQVPINPLSGGTGSFYLTGSSLQIDRNTLLDSGAMTGEVGLNIDENGNVVRTASSSLRYKKDLVDYTTNGEYLLLVTNNCNIKLNSVKDKKIKIKSLSSLTVYPDLGLIDNKWESLELSGDSCVEFVFVEETGYWIIVSSDGIKDS